MSDLGVIDQFFDTFNRYIDSGFGLLRGDVASLATTLVAIDVTLAALFWTWSAGEDVLARLVRKTLYVGFFAFLIGNYQRLANIVMASFAGLGLKASGAGMSAEDLFRPGKLASAGFSAAKPLLEAAAELCGFPGFFENLVQVLVLLIAWLIVLLAFFVMAVQLFVTLVEFKIVTLAGFALVPFGLFGKTAFLAEKVLGGVMASGVKVLVMAVIVGIGSTLFDTFVQQSGGEPPTLEAVAAMALAALTLLGLSIFSPSVASGLVSGAPQLGAGAAVGTSVMVGGVALAGAGVAQMAAGGSAATAAAGARGVTGPAGRPNDPPPSTHSAPPQGGGPASGGHSNNDSRPRDASEEPAWARDMKARQTAAHGVGLALHAAGSGDDHSGGAGPKLSED